MSIYSIIAGLLHPISPDHWKVTEPTGAQCTVTKSDVHLVAQSSPLRLDFEYTAGTAVPVILFGTVDLQGNAMISLNGTDQTNHPVIHAGTAVIWEPFPTFHVILKFIFDDAAGGRKEYRFEGRR